MELKVLNTRLCSYITYAKMGKNPAIIQDLRTTGCKPSSGAPAKPDFSSLYLVCCEVLLSASSFEEFRSNILRTPYSLIEATNRVVLNTMKSMQAQNGGRLMLRNAVPVVVVYSENMKTGVAMDTSYINEQNRLVLGHYPHRFGVSKPLGGKVQD